MEQTGLPDGEILRRRIRLFTDSKKRKSMMDGDRYFRGLHDILKNKRLSIDAEGNAYELKFLPNNKIIDNKYRKYALQIQNYFVGRPFIFRTENEQFSDLLDDVFTHRFRNTITKMTADVLNHGIAWIGPYVTADNELKWRRYAGYEIIPEWTDDDHTELKRAVRIYKTTDDVATPTMHCDVFDIDGVYHFNISNTGTVVIDDINPFDAWFVTDTVSDETEAVRIWDRVPLVAFRANAQELPMLSPCVKSLQDAINKILSNLVNNMLEDPRSSLLVVVNYDGQDAEELRQNLSEYGVLMLRDDGKVDTLHLEVNSANYKEVLTQLSRALMENMYGFDGSADKLGSNPNQMNIQSMYSDIDCFVNGMEREYQASFEDVLYFVKTWLKTSGNGDFTNEDVEIVFNRDVLVNQSQVIADLTASAGILSHETLVAQHPYVDDVDAELERIREENVPIAGDYPEDFGRNDDRDE